MALVLRNIYKFYHYLFNEYKDARVDDLFLVGSPWPIVTILAIYLFIVTGRGQEWMKTRKPFELTSIINVYNILQVFANFYILTLTVYYGPKQDNFRWSCIVEPRDDYSYAGLKILHISHFYYLLKILDLLDTIFFILRKKNQQVTFLHVYHHTAVSGGGYLYLKFMSGGGHALSLGIINSFVHIVMYFYYFLTSYKPEIKQSIWWKKYITQLQLLQFSIIIIHFSIPLFTDCSYSKFILWVILFQNTFMLALFSDFYYKAYIKKKK